MCFQHPTGLTTASESPDLRSSGLSSGLAILPWWFLKGAERNQKLNAFIEFCTLCGWKQINELKTIIKR